MRFFRKQDERKTSKPSPPLDRPYYCLNSDEGPHVFEPVLPAELRFGCMSCKECPTLAEVETKLLARRAIPPRHEAAVPLLAQLLDRRIKCTEHPSGYIVPRCPVCNAVIYPGAHEPPVVLYGGSRAGKTVSCAVFAHEIAPRLTEATGMTAELLTAGDLYWNSAIKPLYDKGRMPHPTSLGEFHRLTWHVHDHDDWPERLLTFLDVAGEWQKHDSGDDVEAAANRNLAHLGLVQAKEAIFLADPEGIPGLKSEVPRDLSELLGALLHYVQAEVPEVVMAWRATGAAAQRRVNDRVQQLIIRWRDILRDHAYPAKDAGGDEPFMFLARELVAALPTRPHAEEELVDSFREHLESLSADPDSASTQVDNFHRNLFRWRGSARDNTFDVNLAFAVTKLDLLHDTRAEYAEIVSAHLGNVRTRKQWVTALEAISAATRQLLQRHDPHLVDKLERTFQSVGYFCISSLGRPVDYLVEPVQTESGAGDDTAQAANPMAYAAATPGAGTATDSGYRWTIKKRLTRQEPMLTRAPDPRYVLLPLLWLFTRPRATL